jgi:4'-phosphopantetheinyl transferase
MARLAVDVDALRDPTVEVWRSEGPEAVRAVLARVAACAPEVIELGATTAGKAVLRSPARLLSFSAARSGRDVLVAVARSGPIGVDIEAVRTLDGLDGALDGMLAGDELALVRASPRERRTRVRYRAWTRKEAFLKAIGIGLAIDPRRVAILPARGASPPHHQVRVDGALVGWRVIDLDAGPAQVAALCGPGGDQCPAGGGGA